MAGIGVLGLPETLDKGGWIALGLIIVSMLIALYTSIIIIKCLYHNGYVCPVAMTHIISPIPQRNHLNFH